MNVWKMLRRSLLIGCVFALGCAQTVFAEVGGNDAEYTYSVTLYAGNQGSFTTASVQTDGASAVIDGPSEGGGQIKITGLRYGDRVSVSAPSSMVALADDVKYYVRGIREGGKDNNTVSESSFVVQGDQDYVIAYGIKGNMVAYTVNYQDGSGNALAESQTFYGVVGDRPVVAFQYIDNYQPQAYNLTRTLSNNESDNVFTFVYSPIAQPATEEGTTGGTETTADGAGTTDVTADGTVTADGAVTGDGTTTDGTVAGTTGATGTAGAAGATGTTDGTAADATGAVAGADANAATDDANQAAAEPEQLIDLDDEEVPLGNLDEDAGTITRPAGNMPLFIGIAAVAILGIIALLVLFMKRRKNEEE